MFLAGAREAEHAAVVIAVVTAPGVRTTSTPGVFWLGAPREDLRFLPSALQERPSLSGAARIYRCTTTLTEEMNRLTAGVGMAFDLIAIG